MKKICFVSVAAIYTLLPYNTLAQEIFYNNGKQYIKNAIAEECLKRGNRFSYCYGYQYDYNNKDMEATVKLMMDMQSTGFLDKMGISRQSTKITHKENFYSLLKDAEGELKITEKNELINKYGEWLTKSEANKFTGIYNNKQNFGLYCYYQHEFAPKSTAEVLLLAFAQSNNPNYKSNLTKTPELYIGIENMSVLLADMKIVDSIKIKTQSGYKDIDRSDVVADKSTDTIFIRDIENYIFKNSMSDGRIQFLFKRRNNIKELMVNFGSLKTDELKLFPPECKK